MDGFLLIYKPKGITSQDVVKKVMLSFIMFVTIVAPNNEKT